MLSQSISRRRFLQQTFAFSVLSALAPTVSYGAFPDVDRNAKHALLIGDWGWPDSNRGQQQVAAGMRHYIESNRLKTEALLMLGDSWYGDLDGGVDSPRWQQQFEEMYPEDILPCPAYSIAGNHDYQRSPMSKVEAELAYSSRGRRADGKTTRWKMPSLWYRIQLPEKDPILTVLALDSNVPGHATFGPGFFAMSKETYAKQMEWLKQELAKPLETPFLAVMGHHPLFSNGRHGDHPVLIKDWDPLFREHKVHLYLGGHDHDLQHLVFADHPTSFFVSGAGGADLYTLRKKQSERGPFASKAYGFSHIEMTKGKLILRHVDESGQMVHAFSKDPSGAVTLL